ncbi:MAG TPA: ROK family transcriptional regulator, partial [Microlunatus sp.]
MTGQAARGARVPGVGQFNESVVLELIRQAPDGISRSRISTESGLSAQTVSSITRRLIKSRLVRETPGQAAGPGKPAAVLQLEPGSRFAVGVHLDPVELSAVVLDLTGTVRVAARRSVQDASPTALMGEIAVLVGETLGLAKVDRSAVVGLGVASPGPIDTRSGVVDPPLLAGWDQVPLRETLHSLTGLPVIIERDVDAAVIGELWLRPEGGRDLMYIYYGTGLNSGIGLDRQVHRGERGRAGHLAHLWSGTGGTRCRCGKYGCLGHNLSPAEILRRAAESGIKNISRASDRESVE